MRTEPRLLDVRPSRLWCLGVTIGCVMLLAACGGVSVIPTTPTDVVPGRRPLERITVLFEGTLADGGSFGGGIVYNVRDIDPREDFGRFIGGAWHVSVKGGTDTKDVEFSHVRRGRAVVETQTLPLPGILLAFLWPDSDPSIEGLTAMFAQVPPYDPDVRPAPRNFGALIPGSLRDRFGIYRDGTGGATVVSGVDFRVLGPGLPLDDSWPPSTEEP
jgi:hypothetical protein